MKFTKSQLIYCLMNADYEYGARAPGIEWPEFYANEFVERFAPDCRVFLFGHFHRAAVLTRGGRLFCNTGGYVGGTRALVVDVCEEEVMVRKVVEEGGEFRDQLHL